MLNNKNLEAFKKFSMRVGAYEKRVSGTQPLRDFHTYVHARESLSSYTFYL